MCKPGFRKVVNPEVRREIFLGDVIECTYFCRGRFERLCLFCEPFAVNNVAWTANVFWKWANA